MTLTEQLLKTDKISVELKEKTFYSQRLQELLGDKEPVAVKLRQIPARRGMELAGMATDKNGNRDSKRIYDAYLMYCVEGVVDPSLKDQNLAKKFGAATPKELAERLFDNEATDIANEIAGMSIAEGDEDEVKN